MSNFEELKKFLGKEINKINKKIQALSYEFKKITEVRYEHEAMLCDIEALDQRLLRLEKIFNINCDENDKINNDINNNIQNNIDNINIIDEGKLFRYQVSRSSRTRKNKKIFEKPNSKEKNILLPETKENKKKKYTTKNKNENKSKKKENTNIKNYNKEINYENNIKYLEDIPDSKNNINSLIIDNYDIMSFGKKDENNILNNSLSTSSAKFSEFSFDPEKLNKKNRNKSQSKSKENINKIEPNIGQIMANPLNNNIINIKNENLYQNFNNKLEDIINSEIIKDINELKLIFNSLSTYNKFDGFPDIQTIFQSSLDGESSNSFHKFCDGEPNLIVLIETNNGERFGGYTKIGFSSDRETKEDDTIFIFNLDKMEIYKKFKKIFRFIYNDPNNGPCFGPQNDIIFQISDNYLKEKSYIREFFNKENEKFCDISAQNKEFIVNKLEILKILIN